MSIEINPHYNNHTYGHIYNSNDSLKTRKGDWICVQCNNLNFSFRKKCNRCKTQTKDQNDQNLQLLLYQYHSTLTNHNLEFPSVESGAEFIESFAQESKALEQSNSDSSEQNNHNCCQRDHSGLPSVSPITRRYQRKSNSETMTGYNLEEDFQIASKYCLQQFCWEKVHSEAEHEEQSFSQTTIAEGSEWNEEISKLLLNIAL